MTPVEQALEEAARFVEYEQHHVAKGALDKAARNREMVTRLDAALSGQVQQERE